VTRSDLTVRARVPGISEDELRSAAEAAKVGCPISNALSKDIELTVDATLES
jgi:osmotically inducible protein OsmC